MWKKLWQWINDYPFVALGILAGFIVAGVFTGGLIFAAPVGAMMITGIVMGALSLCMGATFCLLGG